MEYEYSTDYLDPETGNQFAVHYTRKLTFDECAEACRVFSPAHVVSSAEGNIFIVVPDRSWTPSKLA